MDETWLWIAFGVIVAAILAFDFGIVGRRRATPSLREALSTVAAFVLLGVLFGIAVYAVKGPDAGIAWFTAYLLEQSLSVDNIFVWLLIFEYLEVPENAQRKVLFWGIGGAMLLRGVFIFAGTALIAAFDWVLYVFGAVVLVSAVRMLRAGGGKHDIGASRLLGFLRQHLHVTDDYAGRRFLVRDGKHLCATPLLLAVIFIELTDAVFALDSIPAIFGVTQDRLVIYTSNILAILGLRALYFTVAGLLEHLRYLRYGLAVLLMLIGAKMIAGGFVEIPVSAMLAATVAILAGTIGLSLWRRPARSRRARDPS